MTDYNAQNLILVQTNTLVPESISTNTLINFFSIIETSSISIESETGALNINKEYIIPTCLESEIGAFEILKNNNIPVFINTEIGAFETSLFYSSPKDIYGSIPDISVFSSPLKSINGYYPSLFGGGGASETIYYKLRGYYTVSEGYETYVVTDLNAPPPSGHSLINISIIDTWII